MFVHKTRKTVPLANMSCAVLCEDLYVKVCLCLCLGLMVRCMSIHQARASCWLKIIAKHELCSVV